MNRWPDGLQPIIDRLSELDGVRSAVLVGRDGTPVPGVVVGEDEELIGALTGAIFGTLNKAVQRTGLGELEGLVVSATLGSIQAMAAGDAVLLVLARANSNIGLIRLYMRAAATDITALRPAGAATGA
ncbi:MAG TPA: roadblock/LC7 domain-containing protein [Chloroflexota bacterium]|nr:roadblock/LC7 domain-containing protein [Chloroflexota bacterium]